jgi:hypothetical protein
LVEHQLPKLRVAGSIPVVRFTGKSRKRGPKGLTAPVQSATLKAVAVRRAAHDRDNVGNRSAAVGAALWSHTVVELLDDWDKRAAASSEAHYALAGRLAGRNIRLGVPVVALTTIIGTSVFATLQEDVTVVGRLAVGVVSVLAAVLASVQTFLRFAERSEQHRAAAEAWAAIRREIRQKRALHPEYEAARGDPNMYLDGLRKRIDHVSRQSPEMGEKIWAKYQQKHGIEGPALEAGATSTARVGRQAAF